MTRDQINPVIDVERDLREVIGRGDHTLLHRTYWGQSEFLRLEQFLTRGLIEACLCELEQLSGDVHRNCLPGHKQGGTVCFCSIQEKAPTILALYRSVTLRTFFSRLVDSPLELCPEGDPHACAVYYYTKPGDHIGFHYDASYYKGARYTVLIGLVEETTRC